MAFKLWKGNANATAAVERFIASGAIAAGMPVALAAGTTGAELGRVAQLAGGTAATEILYGVSMHAAASGEEVLVLPATKDLVFEVDAVADTNVTSVGQDNYLTATTLTLTVGASTLNGRKCEIIGKLGAAADRVYLVRLSNPGTASSTPAVATTVAYTLDRSAAAFSAAAALVFTAPYAMRIDDVIVNAQATEGSGTVKVLKDTDEICTAIACAADGAVTHMSAGAVVANKARLVLAAGDTVSVQAAGGTATNIRAIVTVLAHRV